MTVKEIKDLLMNNSNVKFKVEGQRKTFKTYKSEDDEYTGRITSDMFSGMNVNKWGPTCVTLYSFDMLEKKSTGKIRYCDIVIVEDDEGKI